MWIWQRAANLETENTLLWKEIKSLKKRLDGHDKDFEDVRVRLSTPETKTILGAHVRRRPSEWLSERQELTDQFAKENKSAK